MKLKRANIVLTSTVALVLLFGASPGFTESKQVRFAEQFGLVYLPMHVVVGEKLVEKHAKMVGLGDISVSMVKLSGGAAVNRALLSGNVEFAAGGMGPLLTIWDKTKGSQDVRAAVDIGRMPYKLITNDARIKRLQDYLNVTDHKIATPSVSSIQAVTLRMAAEKEWGAGNAKKLDPMLVNMKHPDAVVALLSGGQTVKSHFAPPPFSFHLLKSGKTHVVLTSYDVLDGPHTSIALYNTATWKNANPKLYRAVVAAYEEAMKYINVNLDRAAKYYIDFTKSKLKLEDIKAIVGDKNEMEYSLTPRGTMRYAEFMYSTGDIKNRPSSWKDYYHENNHHMEGS